jgi:hypothetical protein
MSLAIVDTPQPFQPVLSDGLYFTLSSSTYDAQTTFKFRFIYELYVEGELVFQGKCSPNPFGLGIVDLQQILESYTNSLPISYWNTTPIYTHQTFPFSRPANEETISYQIACGYEYASSEIVGVTGFTGSGNTIGLPAIRSQSLKTFRSTMGTNPRATQQDFNIGPFVLSGTPTSVYPTISGLFLTNAPRIMDVSPEVYFTLGFTNYYLNSGSTPTILSEPYYVEYNYYNDQGALILTEQYDNVLGNGGGPRSSGCNVYQQLFLIDPPSGTTYNTLYVGAGPANLPNLPANCAQYTVQLYGVFEGETTPIPVTPTPTPTPSATSVISPSPTPSSTPPCTNCNRYFLSYTGESAFTTVTFVNCDTGSSESFQALAGVVYNICSCSTPTGTELSISNQGPCTPVTPTPTPTATPGCICSEYLLENESASSSFFQYIDCTGEAISDSMEAFSVLDLCACDGTIIGDDAINIAYLGPCPTPVPSPSPTRTPVASVTPTPTLTPGCFLSWNINECAGTCSGGICACEGSTPVTVYTDCSVTSITDPFTEIYENTALTNPYTADFVSSGSIYNSTGSGVTLVCNIGGPC